MSSKTGGVSASFPGSPFLCLYMQLDSFDHVQHCGCIQRPLCPCTAVKNKEKCALRISQVLCRWMHGQDSRLT